MKCYVHSTAREPHGECQNEAITTVSTIMGMRPVCSECVNDYNTLILPGLNNLERACGRKETAPIVIPSRN